MTQQEFDELRPDDIVMRKGQAYTIRCKRTYGPGYYATQTVFVDRPESWELAEKGLSTLAGENQPVR